MVILNIDPVVLIGKRYIRRVKVKRQVVVALVKGVVIVGSWATWLEKVVEFLCWDDTVRSLHLGVRVKKGISLSSSNIMLAHTSSLQTVGRNFALDDHY